MFATLRTTLDQEPDCQGGAGMDGAFVYMTRQTTPR